jgi:phage virion morphogenesis protein
VVTDSAKFAVDTSDANRLIEELILKHSQLGRTGVLEALRDHLQEEVSDAFDKQTDPRYGTPWAPPKPWKPYGSGESPMQRIGTLRSSTKAVISNDSYVRVEVSGEAEKYAQVVHWGGYAGRGRTIPRRRFTGLTTAHFTAFARKAKELLGPSSEQDKTR